LDKNIENNKLRLTTNNGTVFSNVHTQIKKKAEEEHKIGKKQIIIGDITSIQK
jgi:hypothetical protein